jgi:sterol desaturase/sphingolipid hydroxylase (fatty acid hydroxylase superfamily)
MSPFTTSSILIAGAALILMVAERIFPDRPLVRVTGWWPHVIFLNVLALATLPLASYLWEEALQGRSLFHFSLYFGNAAAALFGYFVLTFVYYWWHRARHDVNILWLAFHQIHHSPQRLETITAFFKHPAETFVNYFIISALLYPVLGLDIESAMYVNVLTAWAEFFYHMNIRTPQWVGYIIQRPESHRIHHQYGKHYNNFADLPIWDMLFGTFMNPKITTTACGFKPEREAHFFQMLFFKNVNGPFRKHHPHEK